MKHFIGIDIGDKLNYICVLNSAGEVVEETVVANDEDSLSGYFHKFSDAMIAIESCSHSLWLSILFVDLGFEVYVANPRKVKLIYSNFCKSDKADAKILARLVRSDPNLLYPIVIRDIFTQQDLILLKTRKIMINGRGDLIRHIRGIIKPFGYHLPKEVTVENFHIKAKEFLEKDMLNILKHTFDMIKDFSRRIKILDIEVDELIKTKYPEAFKLQTISGVGPITALTFLLIVGDPKRFKMSRDLGAYFGLVPKRDQSGDMDKSLSITKAGDSSMRSLLVNCAQHILGNHGSDSQLRRHGLKIMGSDGNKIRKKKAVVAVARKLAVLMHSMLVSGQEFKNKVA